MLWGQTLLMTGGTCLITLAVTYIFNWVTNGPKRRKEREEKQAKHIEEVMAAAVKDVEEKMNYTLSVYAKSREDSIKERKKLYDTMDKINTVLDERLTALEESNKVQAHGIQMLLRNKIKEIYNTALEHGYAPVEVKEDVEEMYQVYHKLGANGVLDSLRAQFLALPNHK